MKASLLASAAAASLVAIGGVVGALEVRENPHLYMDDIDPWSDVLGFFATVALYTFAAVYVATCAVGVLGLRPIPRALSLLIVLTGLSYVGFDWFYFGYSEGPLDRVALFATWYLPVFILGGVVWWALVARALTKRWSGPGWIKCQRSALRARVRAC